MKNRYQSELLGSLHETAEGLHKIGLLSDKEMHEYDRDCLVSSPNPTYEGTSIPGQKSTPVYASSDPKHS